MQKTTLFLVLLCALLATDQKANATKIAAGCIQHQYIIPSIYDVYAEYYTNCAGDPPPLTMTLCADDLLNPGNTVSFDLVRDSIPGGYDPASGDKVPIGWGPDSTQCDDPSSTIPGYRRWTYYNSIELPYQSKWRLSNYADTLEATDNINAQSYYMENIIDEVTSYMGFANAAVNIPQYKVLYVPAYTADTVHLDAFNLFTDPDSLAFGIDTILTSTGSCVAPTVAPFQAATPAYTIPLNPFQTSNTFTFSQINTPFYPASATLNFTPTMPGNYLFGIKTMAYGITGNGGVYEYHNTNRHIFRIIVVGSSTPLAPCDTFHGGNIGCFTNCIATGDTIIGLYNQPVSFCYNAQSADTNVKYYITDNHIDSIPSATVTYTGQYSDTVTGTFSWTPNTSADTGWHTIVYDIIDTACATGIHYTDTFHIYIPGPVSVSTLANKHQLSLFPNPNNGRFTLTSDIDITGKTEVINTLGKVVYKTTNTAVITLPDGLPNGTYLLRAYRKNMPVNIPFILNR